MVFSWNPTFFRLFCWCFFFALRPANDLEDKVDQVKRSYRPSDESSQNNFVDDVVGNRSEHSDILLQTANKGPAKRNTK